MLASTMHISTNNQPPPHGHTHPATGAVCEPRRDRLKNPNPMRACFFRYSTGCVVPASAGGALVSRTFWFHTLAGSTSERPLPTTCLLVSPPYEPASAHSAEVGPVRLSAVGAP